MRRDHSSGTGHHSRGRLDAATELAAEIKAGDTRIFTADYEDAAGAYAPLTRVFEQLALARGALKPW